VVGRKAGQKADPPQLLSEVRTCGRFDFCATDGTFS